MKAIVFGAAGNVGSRLVRQLTEAGDIVLGVTRQALDLAKNPLAAGDLIVDVAPDMVFNPAAFNGMEACEDGPVSALAVNVTAPTAMAYACKVLDIPFLTFSTDYVFSGHEMPLTEDMPPNPSGAYGRSKWRGEVMVQEIGGKNLILRLSSVFGNKWAGPLGVISQVLNKGMGTEGAPCEVLHQLCCPTSARLIASASIHAARRMLDSNLPLPQAIFHFATSEPVWKQYHATAVLERILGPRPGGWWVKEGTLKVPRPEKTVLSSRAFEAFFGFKIPAWLEDLEDTFPLLPVIDRAILTSTR